MGALDNAISGPQPGFFGKDPVVPFIGYVEDVNDKKHSQRVKIRIPGMHPYKKTGGEKDSVKTEDLPWARVCLPTTMAQQGRVGGTHGLQPGSWVFGFMLDGEDAQQPMIVGCFNMTSRVSDAYNRTNVDDDSDGTLTDQQEGFEKVLDSENHPNEGTQNYTEQSNQGGAETDKAMDNVTEDSVDPCTETDDMKSKATQRQMYEDKTSDNAEAQKYDVRKGDGVCGTNKHARDDMQSASKEMMPGQMDRFTYGDAVWEKMTGNYLDINAILKQMALMFANMLKRPLESEKAETKEEQNREKRSEKIKDEKDRTGIKTFKMTDQLIKKDDELHGAFQTGFIDILIQLIFSMLTGMNNSGGGGGGGGGEEGQQSGGNQGQAAQNYQNNPGAFPNTKIQNPGAWCLTDKLLEDIYLLCDDALEKADAAALTAAKDYAKGGGSDNQSSSDSGGGGGGGGGGGSAISSIMGMLKQAMKYPLDQKYADHEKSLNKAKDKSQDELTKDEGCNEDRMYNTEEGDQGSSAGMA